MGVAATFVGGEDLVVAEVARRLSGQLAHGVQDAGFEIDQGADDVKGENLEMAERRGTERHGRFFSLAGTGLTDVHSAAFGTTIVSSGWRTTVMGSPGGGMRRYAS